MSDRELLELAAKAAGIELIDWHDCWADVGPGYRYRVEDGSREVWNPFTRDGDALRLAADLDINIEWFPRQRYVSAGRLRVGEIVGWVDESGRSGALRRAVTVAASQIGRAMP